jgi:hypothetical protein
MPAPRGIDEPPQLRVESPRATLRIVILSPQQRRNRPRRERDPTSGERLTASQLRALLAESDEGSPADQRSQPAALRAK